MKRLRDPKHLARVPRHWGIGLAFLRNLIGTDERACIDWPLGRNRHGYGRVRHSSESRNAHSVMWEIVHGRRPERNEDVRHTCDNRLCVNPNHLLIGSRADNVRDAVERDRHTAGERNGCAKLTREIAQDIRRRCASGETHQAVADIYGVHPGTVSKVVLGTRWRGA